MQGYVRLGLQSLPSHTLFQHDVSCSFLNWIHRLLGKDRKCAAIQDDMLTTPRMLRKGVEKYHTAVIAVSVYVAAGYIVVITFLVGVWCRPFHIYYDTIPVPAANGMSHSGACPQTASD